MQVVDRLATFAPNIRHESPATRTVPRRIRELRSDGVHAREEGRVFRRISQIGGRADVHSRNEEQMHRRLRCDVFDRDDQRIVMTAHAGKIAVDDAAEETGCSGVAHAPSVARTR